MRSQDVSRVRAMSGISQGGCPARPSVHISRFVPTEKPPHHPTSDLSIVVRGMDRGTGWTNLRHAPPWLRSSISDRPWTHHGQTPSRHNLGLVVVLLPSENTPSTALILRIRLSDICPPSVHGLSICNTRSSSDQRYRPMLALDAVLWYTRTLVGQCRPDESRKPRRLL